MATMKELVLEYREASAKLAMYIAEKKAAGVSPAELQPLQDILKDIREVQRLMDGYYDVPRSSTFAAVGWKARKINDEKS